MTITIVQEGCSSANGTMPLMSLSH